MNKPLRLNKCTKEKTKHLCQDFIIYCYEVLGNNIEL